MKLRSFPTLALAMAVAFSITLASEKGEKSAKSAKKDMKSCCADTKTCTDKDMKNCKMKGAKASNTDAKADVKDVKKSDGEKK